MTSRRRASGTLTLMRDLVLLILLAGLAGMACTYLSTNPGRGSSRNGGNRSIGDRIDEIANRALGEIPLAGLSVAIARGDEVVL
ncbi:MAG: hypothetical protein V2A73_15125, partial [Pseudomonadota bacterium]